MRILSFLVLACIGLALMQAAAKLAVIVAIIAGLATFAARPRETVGCFGGLLLLGLVAQFPVVALLLISTLVLARHLIRD